MQTCENGYFYSTVRLRQPARASFSGVVDHSVEIAEFSVTKILREIKMGESRVPKSFTFTN